MSGCDGDTKVTNVNHSPTRGGCMCDKTPIGTVGNGDLVWTCVNGEMVPSELAIDLPEIPAALPPEVVLTPQSFLTTVPSTNLDPAAGPVGQITYTITMTCPPAATAEDGCPHLVEDCLKDANGVALNADCIVVCRNNKLITVKLRPPVEVFSDAGLVVPGYDATCGKITYKILPTPAAPAVDLCATEIKARGCDDYHLACDANGLKKVEVCPPNVKIDSELVDAFTYQNSTVEHGPISSASSFTESGTVEFDLTDHANFCPGKHNELLVQVRTLSRIEQITADAVNATIGAGAGYIGSSLNLDGLTGEPQSVDATNNDGGLTYIAIDPVTNIATIPYLIEGTTLTGEITDGRVLLSIVPLMAVCAI